jgi:ACS family hexuronate transporter-like MFS transporter
MMESGGPAGTSGGAGNFRWVICALLFVATTVNYVDRQVISILKSQFLSPLANGGMGWTELDFANVVFYFQLAYAFMMLGAGAIIDRIGIRWGFALAIIWWSLAAMGHALAGTVVAFIVWRVLLGVGEAANFPACIKTIAEWFPRRERALATGVFNSGTNIGAVVTPFAVAWVLATFNNDWRWVFILAGLIGFFWLVFWFWLYRQPEEHPRVSPAELAYIQSEPEPKLEKPPWFPLLKFRQTWAFTIGKFMTDPIWWFFLFWGPGFLNRKFQVEIGDMGTPILAIYMLASVGSIVGGYLSAGFLKRGWSPNAARKTAMLICAISVVPVVFAAVTPNLWVAVLLIGLACAAHQGWSANIFTLTSDMFPKKAVGSVTGIGGFAGGLGGCFFSLYVGKVLKANPDNYLPILIIAGSIYLLALLIIQFLAPRLEKAEI